MSINNRASVVLLALVAVILVVASSIASAQSNYKTLYTFASSAGGSADPTNQIFDQAGNLYGTSAGGGAFCEKLDCGQVYKLTPNSGGVWTKTILYSFCSLKNCTDGSGPSSDLIFDQSGNLYGETYTGGNGLACNCGVVFELIPTAVGSWTDKVLHRFAEGADGELPIGGLTFDQAGSLYGTTLTGGSVKTGLWLGVVFELTPLGNGSWKEKILHAFPDPFSVEGGEPQSGVIFDEAGNLYGTTLFGGNLSRCGNAGCGVVFELIHNADGSWTEKALHRFGGGDGFGPGSLIFDRSGNLYTMTSGGGYPSQCGGGGCGVVLRLTPNADGSWTENVLHYFTGGKDGGTPNNGLVINDKGSLIGTAVYGGNLSDCTGTRAPNGSGVVFKLAPNLTGGWKETVVQYFGDRPGAHPDAGVIFDAVGNIYGTTTGDSTMTFGSVFEITP
jgi:uncharacterized repeat protein (TIGR03803 family)